MYISQKHVCNARLVLQSQLYCNLMMDPWWKYIADFFFGRFVSIVLSCIRSLFQIYRYYETIIAILNSGWHFCISTRIEKSGNSNCTLKSPMTINCQGPFLFIFNAFCLYSILAYMHIAIIKLWSLCKLDPSECQIYKVNLGLSGVYIVFAL